MEDQRCYTRTFSGTSSATAIVAGVVACISGVVKAHGLEPLPPVAMRELLRRSTIFAGPGEQDRIGPLANLREALLELEQDLPGGFQPAPPL